MISKEALNVGAIDAILRQQIDKGRLHNACFYAYGDEGILYSGLYGSRDVAGTQPVAMDSVYWIASLTKLSTAIAALIAVEKGLVSLDQNVREIVPELKDIDVLDGFDKDSQPLLRKCTLPITLRQLLSHSSGFCYDLHHPQLKRWNTHIGRDVGTFTGSYEGYHHPLIFDPGEGWAYGPGMDWAGLVEQYDNFPRCFKIEIVANQDLESFMKTHIWDPLLMESTTFRPWTRPDISSRLVELAWRKPNGTLTKGQVPFGYPAKDCCGGVGLYSTPHDQAKIMSALLRGTIISSKSMDQLLRPQTKDPSHFRAIVCGTGRGHLGQTWPAGSQGDFGLSSSINEHAFPSRRAANSANWQGMPGVHAWLDLTSGVTGLFVTSILPPGDETVTSTVCALEEAVYAARGSSLEN